MTRPVHQTMTAAEWAASNPVLRRGTVGFESDTSRSKLGDGSTAWLGLRYANRTTPVPSSLLIASDSYQDPTGVVTSTSESVGERVRVGLGIDAARYRNLAVSGAMARNHFTGCSYAAVWQLLGRRRAAAPYVPDVGLVEFKYGTNDAIRGAGANQLAGYDHAVRSIIRRAQAGSVYLHNDASITRTGTGWTQLLWANLAAEPNLNTAHSPAFPWGGGTGCWRSKTINDMVTIAVPADHTGIVDLYLIGSWYGAHYNILVDGATWATNQYTGGLGLDVYGAPLYDERNGLVVSVPLTAGAHTVSLRITSADTGGGTQNPGELRFDSWSIRCSTGTDPLILACETPFIPNPGFYWAGVTAPVVAIYNQHLRAVAAAVNGGNGRSWPVQVVPTERIETPATFPDGAGHPNIQGAALFAGAIIDAYNGAVFPPLSVLWAPSWLGPVATSTEHGTRLYRANVGPTGYSDLFNRANTTTTLGVPWSSNRGTWGINTNAAYLSADNGALLDAQLATVETLMPNGRVSAVIATGSTLGDNHGLVFRYIDVNNFLSLVMSTTFGGWVLRAYEAGTITRTINVAGPQTVGGTVTVDFDGTQIAVYFDGSLTSTGAQSVTQHRGGTRCGLTAPWGATALRWDAFSYGVPASAAAGDWWFDSATASLYGPYTGTTWPGPVSTGGSGGGGGPVGALLSANNLTDVANGATARSNLVGQGAGVVILDEGVAVPGATPAGTFILRRVGTGSGGGGGTTGDPILTELGTPLLTMLGEPILTGASTGGLSGNEILTDLGSTITTDLGDAILI